MATWGPVTVAGEGRWWMWDENCTNHEAFAFQLEVADVNVGAALTEVDVYVDTFFAGNTPTYGVTVQAVDINGNPTSDVISGYFNSNGV
jgi:hypothetical protein